MLSFVRNLIRETTNRAKHHSDLQSFFFTAWQNFSGAAFLRLYTDIRTINWKLIFPTERELSKNFAQVISESIPRRSFRLQNWIFMDMHKFTF